MKKKPIARPKRKTSLQLANDEIAVLRRVILTRDASIAEVKNVQELSRRDLIAAQNVAEQQASQIKWLRSVIDRMTGKPQDEMKYPGGITAEHYGRNLR